MGEADTVEEATTVTYDVVACSIFAVMAFVFLFPCNPIIPLDRRTVAVLGSVVCYTTRAFCFPHRSNLSILDAVDWDVLLLLASIMIVNHLVVNQAETKYVITKLRRFIKSRPLEGFWVISFAAFVISPFLTNDGVCLLFVEPLLSVFSSSDTIRNGNDDMSSPFGNNKKTIENSTEATLSTSAESTVPFSPSLAIHSPTTRTKDNELCSKDAIFFLLTLACSANIGSALTYTGNPQNMIVSGDLIAILPPGMFLLYQLLPSLVSWVITTGYVYHCWSDSVRRRREVAQRWMSEEDEQEKEKEVSANDSNKITVKPTTPTPPVLSGTIALAGSFSAFLSSIFSRSTSGSVSAKAAREQSEAEQVQLVTASDHRGTAVVEEGCVADDMESGVSAIIPVAGTAASTQANPTSPTLGRTPTNAAVKGLSDKAKPTNGHIVVSPLPYLVLFILLVMITMIFVDVMSIASLICITAMVMIVSVTMGNHWRNQLTMVPHPPDSDSEDENVYVVESEGGPKSQSQTLATSDNRSTEARSLTRQERTDNLTHFFDDLFNSVDYSLLLIFLGTFIVVANVESTGLPKKMWSQIVGNVPFRSAGSVIGISLFVLLASQFLGNVAIIQMAKPNISSLSDEDKKYAWVLISFIATVGGNLTITGSAANIIVAEKARRIDPNAPIEFFNHFRVCFLITIASCILGGAIITWTMGQQQQ